MAAKNAKRRKSGGAMNAKHGRAPAAQPAGSARGPRVGLGGPRKPSCSISQSLFGKWVARATSPCSAATCRRIIRRAGSPPEQASGPFHPAPRFHTGSHCHEERLESKTRPRATRPYHARPPVGPPLCAASFPGPTFPPHAPQKTILAQRHPHRLFSHHDGS